MLFSRPRIFDRLDAQVVSSEEQRIERILAAARSFLAISALIAIWLDPTEPSRYTVLAYFLMGLYVIHSLAIQFLVLIRASSTRAFRFTVHAVDVLWPTVMSLFTAGPNSPFFAFNVFVLFAAAYRWGFLETIATSGAAILLYSSIALLSPSRGSPPFFFLAQEFEPNRFLIFGIYLLIMGYLIGYLGEEEKQLRSEALATARITTRLQSEAGVRGAVQAALDELARLFGSNQSLVVLNEAGAGQAFLWKAGRPEPDEPVSVTVTELDATQRATYLFEPPATAWYAERKASSRKFKMVTLDENGKRRRNVRWTPPEGLLAAHSFRRALGLAFAYGEEWSGILLILEPTRAASGEAASFLLTLSRQIGPALYNVYLNRRLRSRAGAVERARVARELHDGVIQSLIGLEMQIDVLKRAANGPENRVGPELGRIQTLLRQEVLNLRELMQQIKPVDLGPKQLLDFFAYSVDKFRSDTGIAAKFTSAFDEVRLPSRVSNELARILQEALANIRKHSGAQNVLVRLDSADGHWKLTIDDDGRGFDFTGRLSHLELDATRRGPLVIKERVRAIGGELTVDSMPGRGSRLEVIFPQKKYG